MTDKLIAVAIKSTWTEKPKHRISVGVYPVTKRTAKTVCTETRVAEYGYITNIHTSTFGELRMESGLPCVILDNPTDKAILEAKQKICNYYIEKTKEALEKADFIYKEALRLSSEIE